MVRVSGQRDFRIQGVVQVLNNDPFCTLPELAHNCQISSSRLSHLFKDEIGINVKHYRLDCRLQMAAEMLVSTNRPIKEIAYLVGYRHCSSFVRAFSTHVGLSPAWYRKKQLERAAQQHLLTNSKRC
jgi:AraC family transcriptional regulator, arabinose operon regulatory protein